MRVTIGGDWSATVTAEPLALTPRFTGNSVDLAGYGSPAERERFLGATFGSQAWLWDTPDLLRFDPDNRRLVGAEFQLPYVTVNSDTVDDAPAVPPVRPGGLVADEARDFRLEMCMALCREPGDAALTCLRDLDVLAEPLEAAVGIAPDLALLVQRGAVVGWRLNDPVRHLTHAFAAPDPAPPAPATRRLLTTCLDVVSPSAIEDLMDGDPTAVTRLRAADQALRAQTEDRHRADALLALIANLMEDYGG
ncbi:hypothetical protein ACFY7C_16795 [Streptomyces sp. NPDC012769]|uniref:hypothetical protein n=1 Tax=Streptomyces sp. NPDC012769 TaxID=3364848 RepID=UPI0036C19210